MIPPTSGGIALAVPGGTMAAMTSRSDSPISPGMYVPTADHRIVVGEYTWDTYQAQLVLRGQRRRPKLAYLDGALELMSPSRDHERIKSRIGMVIEAYLAESRIPAGPYGEWTLGDESGEAGAEPDECYVFGSDPDAKPRPDLVIEVIWTHGGLDKLEIYKRLDVPEVWFWKDNTISVHALGPAGYVVRERSLFVPDLDLELVCRLLDLRLVSEVHDAIREASRR